MPQTPTEKPKGKIKSIMDAVTALTTLGDEESGSDSETKKPSAEENPTAEGDIKEEEATKEEPASPAVVQAEEQAVEAVEVKVGTDESKPRYIPEHKKPDAALTFPEKLMNMMKYADQFKDDDTYSIAWVADGKSFVVRTPDVFARQVLPKFFKPTKFASFTRKLYRWGFRQVNRGIGPDDPIIFGNEHFQRDDEELMVKMRSVTAAANRRNRNDPLAALSGRKRSLEELDEQRKMILLDRYMQEKAAMGGNGGGGVPPDPRYMAQYGAAMGMRPFPGGFPQQGMPPGMMMQGRFPPGMMMPQPGQPPQSPGGGGGQQQMQQQPMMYNPNMMQQPPPPPPQEGEQNQEQNQEQPGNHPEEQQGGGEGGDQPAEEQGGDNQGTPHQQPPPDQQQQQQYPEPQQHPQQQQPGTPGGSEQEIVNAAISALRYAA